MLKCTVMTQLRLKHFAPKQLCMYDNRPLMLNNNAHSAKLHLHFTWKCLKKTLDKKKSEIHTYDDQDREDCQMMLIF